MARYRIKYVKSCDAYFVQTNFVSGGWKSLFSYSHKNWRGKELKQAIKAVRRLIQIDKQNRKRGK